MSITIHAQTVGNVAGRDVIIGSPGFTSRQEDVRTVLFVASDPRGVTAVRLLEELREVEEALQLAGVAGQLRIEAVPSARPRDLQAAILRHQPEIVHLAGHGTEAEIVLEDDTGEPLLTGATWLNTMLSGAPARCVLLNVCRSAETARLIAYAGRTIIGWDGDVDDDMAVTFSGAFYTAIGYGLSYARSFEQAKAFVYGAVQPVLVVA